MDIHGPASVRNAKTESKKHEIRTRYFFQVTKQLRSRQTAAQLTTRAANRSSGPRFFFPFLFFVSRGLRWEKNNDKCERRPKIAARPKSTKNLLERETRSASRGRIRQQTAPELRINNQRDVNAPSAGQGAKKQIRVSASSRLFDVLLVNRTRHYTRRNGFFRSGGIGRLPSKPFNTVS